MPRALLSLFHLIFTTTFYHDFAEEEKGKQLCLTSNIIALNLDAVLAFYIWLFDCIQFIFYLSLSPFFQRYSNKYIGAKPGHSKGKVSFVLGGGALV